jgi:N-acetylmuramoyl-L-alanine amidase
MKQTPKIVILHCSDTPDLPVTDPGFDRVTAAKIDEWHRQKGWQGCGYHHIIRRSGIIEPGRSETMMGAHVEGQNRDSIGVCLIGKREFTEWQIPSLVRLYHEIYQRWGITSNRWYGHYEFTQRKTCPNIPMVMLRYFLSQSTVAK